MITNPAAQPSLGRALGELNRLVGKLHHQSLAEYGEDFPSWMLLTLLAEQDDPTPIADVLAELDERADLTEPDAMLRLDRAATNGYVDYRPDAAPAVVSLTESGREHFATLYAHARSHTGRAFDGIAPADLETALAVALAAKDRAAQVLAGTGE